MTKQDIKDALFELPAGLGEHINKEIPVLETISMPTDVDSAIVAQGILAYNINLILKEFEGLYLLRVFLHIGQHNTALQALAALSMQIFETPGLFTIISPEATAPGSLADITFSLTTSDYDNVTEASVTAVEESSPENSITIMLAQDATDPTVFSEVFVLSDGIYTLTFCVSFGDQTVQKTQALQVGGV